jgi:HAMP domain-containing protein
MRYRTTSRQVRKIFLYYGLIIFCAPAAFPQAASDPADRIDEIILQRTLYGHAGVQAMTQPDGDAMLGAATRLVERARRRLDDASALVDQGVYAARALAPLKEDLTRREKALSLARGCAALLDELAEIVRAEQSFAQLEEPSGPKPVRERFDGAGTFSHTQFTQVLVAFEAEFRKPLPVSAYGETALHRAMGFDHRGRVDVAVNPDQAEGVWLRHYLELARIPYYAFRAAMAGKATAAHIHIGPASTRLKVAD